MRRFTLLLIAGMAASAGPAARLMPLPAGITAATGQLPVTSSFQVSATGYSDARLESAMRRLEARIFRQTGFASVAPKHTVLTIQAVEPGTEFPSLGEDESYRLDISHEGARITARTVTGALHGMETFAQLVAPGPDGFAAPALHIDDRPRFPWRGLMMDVSRHWMPVAVVLRNLDAMAAVKLNVFHWHLSDDQGFRVESKRYPRLQQFGSDGKFYSQAEIHQVVNYARDRGIRVIPEFDIPGHTSSWFAGYPELASAPGPYEIERAWGIFEPAMNPAREETYRFLDGFLGEMATLFPDPYFHIGGDEVEEAQWKRSAAVQSFAREHNLATSRELQTYFNQRVQELLKKHGKIMIGWDEVLAPGLAADTVIQSWRGADSLAEAARKGYRAVLSSGYYLDHLKPASFHYAVDPLDGAAGHLDPDQEARILGGEACMWAEYASEETVDSRMWPRVAAIAERFWSPRKDLDPASLYVRLEGVSRALEWAGAQHRASYTPMLDRLTGGRPSEPVRILADSSESLGIEVRRDARKYTSLVDLNRFVDAVRPESESVRHLEQDVALAGQAPSPERAELRARFQEWAQNDARLAPLEAGNPLIAELKPLSRNLSALGVMGLRALEYLESGKAAPENWIAEQRRAIDRMEEPCAEVKLAAVRPVRLLLDEISRR